MEKAAYSNASTTPNYSLSYDSYGRVSTLTDAPGSETYAYDDLDNVTETQRSWTSGPTSVEIAYGYNEDGSIASMAFPGLASQLEGFATGATDEFTYSYDDIGRMIGMKNPLTDPFAWTYLDNSWLDTQTSEYGPSSDYDVVNTGYTYDARGEMTDLKNTNASGSTYSEFGNTSDSGSQYDPTGNRLYESSSYPSYTTYSGDTTYSYDYKNELTGEGTTRDGGSGTSLPNTYDTVGNLTELRGTTIPTANSDNQLTSTGYTYDGNGNPTTYAGHTLTFDPENRMTGYTSTGYYATYGYGADGLEASSTTGGTTTYYLDDIYGNPVLELTGSGTSPTVAAFNTFGLSGVLSRYTSGSSAQEVFYAFDMQGNTVERLSSSGALDSSMMYDGFGERYSSNTSPADFYSYFGGSLGYKMDAGSGLELLGHRWYDPASGRFINRDPIGYAGGIDLYSYTGNDPTGFIDPSGFYDAWTSDFSSLYINNPVSGLLGGPLNGFLGGSVSNLGTVMGEADSGCASGWQVAGAAAGLAANVGMLFIPGGGEAKGAELVGDGAMDLYRAVGLREFESVMKNKAFLPG